MNDKKKKWGGTRKGAGRKKAETTKKTTVVRVDEKLLQIIKKLKERLKAGESVESLSPVTNNQDDLQAQLKQYKQSGLKLVLERDREHLRAVKLESKVRSQQSDIRSLKKQLEELKHLEYDCQILTKSGSRCTKTAKIKTNWHGVAINTCLQHSKII